MLRDSTVISGGACAPREYPGPGHRAGLAKDKLILIIVCVVALSVAAFVLVRMSSPSAQIPRGSWQCLGCDRSFNMKTTHRPPFLCPECGDEAVRLSYRTCPKCGQKVLVCRLRPANRPKTGMFPPMDIQFWLKQDDGSYGWTLWIDASSPQVQEIERGLRCSKCGADLSSSAKIMPEQLVAMTNKRVSRDTP